MIKAESISKRYAGLLALDNISFSIKKGEICGLLGPNGAGKTSTIRILTGFMSPSSGKVLIDGMEMKKNPVEAKRKIGYLPESTPLYGYMRVAEYLLFCAKAKGVKKPDNEVQRVLANVGIEARKDSLIGNLSKGLKQRVGIGQALIGDPEILILDEPTIGLDPKQITQMRTLIANLGADKTVIISSHILTEIQAVCTRVIIINEGKIIANDKIENLGSADKKSPYTVSVEISGDEENQERVVRDIRNIDGVKSVAIKTSSRTSLEDIYVELIK